MIGQKIGVYEVLSQIGEGGMGKVFRGLDSLVNREVAIKALHPALLADQGLVERFRTEAMTMAKLQHASICQLYSLVPDAGQYFMIMELLVGETLEDILKKSGSFEYIRGLGIFGQVLEGFAYAHSKGVIHRDIKPANVMLCSNDHVKIMDFGIARVLGSSRMTMTGHLVGTPAYMSPEQITGADVDARSDIYSLGILLYQMLTGQVPFRKTSDFAILRAQVEELPPSPRELVKHVSPEMERILLKALAKSPTERFQTAAEFLDAILNSVPEAANFLVTGSQRIKGGPRTGESSASGIYGLSPKRGRFTWSVARIATIATAIFGMLAAAGWGVHAYRAEKAEAAIQYQRQLREVTEKLGRERAAEKLRHEQEDEELKRKLERQRKEEAEDRRLHDAEREKERIRSVLR